MRKITTGAFVLLVPLLATPVSAQQQPQQAKPEGNTGAGAAMGGAQRDSAGGTVAPPSQPTTSPRPPGSNKEGQARRRPEGNLGSGAAMTGSQRNSTGAPATGGRTSPPPPSTQSPRQ